MTINGGVRALSRSQYFAVLFSFLLLFLLRHARPLSCWRWICVENLDARSIAEQ